MQSVIFNNLVSYPDYLSINLLMKSKIISAVGISEQFNNILKVEGTIKPDQSLVDIFYRHTENMNIVRGFNIFDIQPELSEIFK